MAFDAIVFFIPEAKMINGGVLSIFSLCEETRSLLPKASVYISVKPGFSSYKKNDLFNNSEIIYDMDTLLPLLPKKGSILFHVPEYIVKDFTSLIRPYTNHLPNVNLQINILNQNTKLMPDRLLVADLFSLTPTVTQTLAHKKSCTQNIANLYAIPSHLFSVFIDPSQYKTVPYSKKENIIAYSPDYPPEKAQIVQKLKNHFASYTFIEIDNMSYEDYKKLIRKAKFVITFGEGMDGYFIEPTFSGTISFSVFNSDYFSDDSFKKLTNVFASYKDMSDKIIEIIESLDNEPRYKTTLSPTYDKLSDIYSIKAYRHNIADYYSENYSFQPTPKAMQALFYDKLSPLIPEHEQLGKKLSAEISAHKQTADDLQECEGALNDIYQSKKWRYATKIQQVISALIPTRHK